jgi:battenin
MDEKENNYQNTEIKINDKQSDDKTTEEKEKNNLDPYKSKKVLIYFCFAFIGLFNNLGYTLMITGAQQFSNKVNNDALIAFYPFALIALNTVARFINSRCLIKLSYFKRILGLSIYYGSGYVLLFAILTMIDNIEGFNNTLAFLLTLIPTIIMGTGQCLGEATFLGYIRTFPEDYISGWSTGTGIAGISAAVLSLTFKLIGENFDLKNLYIIVSPAAIVFFFAYYITYRVKANIDATLIKEEETFNNISGIEVERKTGETLNNDKETQNRPSDLLNENQYSNRATDVSLNEELSCKNFVLGFRYGKRYIINMFIVYFLEYCVCTGFCERANHYKYVDSKGAFYENAQYEAFLLFYQLGVFLSRSSLFIFKYLKFVELLNIIQLCNFIFWFIEACIGMVSNQYVCFVTLVFLGLCGGGVYVGCFYFVLNDTRIPPQYKELVLNIATLFNDIGVLLSSIICVIFDNTFLK